MAGEEREQVRVAPPPPTRREPVVDELHGRRIVDPYRWLEDCDAAETVEWTEQQNRRTRGVLEELPHREVFTQRLRDALSHDTVADPKVRGGILFYTLRRGGADQPCLMVAGDGEDRVLLDPGAEDERGLVSLDWWYPSPDGRRVAYGYSRSGDEWSTLRVVEVATGEDHPDRIERARGASVAWTPDGSAFYYTRYPHPGEVPEGEEFYHRRVFHHSLGDDPARDPLVFGEGRPREEMYHVQLSADGRYLLLSINHGWRRTDLYVRDESIGGEFIPVAVGEDALFSGDFIGDTLYLLTNLDAPRYRVIAVDIDDPDLSSHREVMPEGEDLTLGSMATAGGSLVLGGLRDAVSRLLVCDPGDSQVRWVPMPFSGTVSGLTAEGEDSVHFVLQSFARAPAVYRLDPDALEMEVVRSSDQPFDPDEYVVNQHFFTSRDGTRVPMFLVHRWDADPEGPVPTALTGYGGFNISRTPSYSPVQLTWVDAGGIYALANLRGGSEYGQEWHRAGMRQRKQNVFDDFTAAAEYLIREGYTDPDRLGIFGGSNGGLLVGAAMTQRPELFGAVVCGVPLLDMIRYHRFLIAAIWASEYGSADDPEQFEWLYAYSPYHRVVDGEEYPPILLHTAAHDSRVHPMHARKMAARLQEANASGGPVLLFVQTDAGHGAGKPVYKVVQSHADTYSFLAWQLGLGMANRCPGEGVDVD